MSGIGTRRVFVLLGPRIPNETPVSFPNETLFRLGLIDWDFREKKLFMFFSLFGESSIYGLLNMGTFFLGHPVFISFL